MLAREFLAKNKTVIMPQPLFPLPKTEDTDLRKAFCFDWGDQRKIETRAVDDTKKRVSEVFRGLEKSWHKCIILEGSYFEGNKMVIDK